MNEKRTVTRRAVLAASAGLASYGATSVNAEMTDEGKEILLAIKRIIDEDLIDQPELASQILGVGIEDYRGPNEEARPVQMIGVTRLRKTFTSLTASIIASDQPQRVTFGITEFVVNGFAESVASVSWITDSNFQDIFGKNFTLASARIRPMWRPGTDFTGWSGNFPNDTMVYPLKRGTQIEMLAQFGSQTQLANITLRAKRNGAK